MISVGIFLFSVLGTFCLNASSPRPKEVSNDDPPEPTTYYVKSDGSNENDCLSNTTACQTIKYVLESAGDEGCRVVVLDSAEMTAALLGSNQKPIVVEGQVEKGLATTGITNFGSTSVTIQADTELKKMEVQLSIDSSSSPACFFNVEEHPLKFTECKITPVQCTIMDFVTLRGSSFSFTGLAEEKSELAQLSYLVKLEPPTGATVSMGVELKRLFSSRKESRTYQGLIVYSGPEQSTRGNDEDATLTLTLDIDDVKPTENENILTMEDISRPVVLHGSVRNIDTVRDEGGGMALYLATTGSVLISGMTFENCKMTSNHPQYCFGAAFIIDVSGADPNPPADKVTVRMEDVKFGSGNGNNKMSRGRDFMIAAQTDAQARVKDLHFTSTNGKATGLLVIAGDNPENPQIIQLGGEEVGSGLSGGAVAGIVIAVLVVVAIVAVVVVLVVLWKLKKGCFSGSGGWKNREMQEALRA